MFKKISKEQLFVFVFLSSSTMLLSLVSHPIKTNKKINRNICYKKLQNKTTKRLKFKYSVVDFQKNDVCTKMINIQKVL